MSAPTRPPRKIRPPEEPGLEESRQSPWRVVARAAIVVTVLGIILMWVYAFWGQHDVPGRLADPTFATSVGSVCDATVVTIEALPKANTTRDPAQRADVVDQGTDALDQMLVQLRAATPAAEPEHSIVSQWLDDWDTYVGNRREYTVRLRQDPNARFFVTQSDRDKTQITNAIDHFAEVNKVPGCATPDDLS